MIDDQQRIREAKAKKMSKGEDVVATFLMQNGIKFVRNWYFNELSVGRRRKLFFYDFYCLDYKCCIEYDGKQHYTHQFNGIHQPNSERNDFLKTAFCKKKGIPLLRIKYCDQKKADELICNFFDKHFPVR